MKENVYETVGYTDVYNPETGAVEKKSIFCTVRESSEPSQMDIIEAQIVYTAMMTNTLLEV